MIVRLRKIGNSTGIILSKSILEQCDIKDEVKVQVQGESIVIQPIKRNPREGWEEQFLAAGSLEQSSTLMGDFGNSFDEEEWTW